VRKIPQETFQSLLLEPMTQYDKKIVLSFMKAQNEYGLLTKRRYAYFWTIHNKYLPIVELEYPDTVKVKVSPGSKTTSTRVGYRNK
jgi:hypothetical protein